MANTIPPVLIELQLETAKIAAQMQQLQGNFSEFGKTVQKQSGFLSQFKATAAGMFAGNAVFTGLNMLKGAFGAAIQDAQQYEVLLNKTKAVIASTGNVASISVKGLQDQASALEKISAIDENVILNGENVIATFTNIRNVAGAGNDVFDQTTKAALDLSAALGQDMQSSAIQLGKALNDPIKGVSALQRVGVTFTAAQKEQIKALVDSGKTLEAQKVILAEVNREFGGAAKAAGDTFAGAVFRAKDKAADFARDLITNLQPVLLRIGKAIGDLYNKFLVPLFSFIAQNKNVVLALGTAIVVGYTAFKVWNAVLVVSKAIQTAWTVATTIMKGAQLASIASTNGMAASMLALNAAMRNNVLGIIITLLAAAAAGMIYLWNHSEAFRKLLIGIGKAGLSAIGWIISTVGDLITAFLKFETGPLRLVLKGLAALGNQAAKDALKTIDDGIKNTGDFFDKTAKKVESYGSALDKLATKKPNIKTGYGENAFTYGTQTATGIATAPDDGPSAAATKAAAAAAKKRLAELQKYQKQIASINKEIAQVQADAAEKRAKIDADYGKQVIAINKEFEDKRLAIQADYAKKAVDLETKAAQQRASIVQKSKDLLINAFQNATKVDLAGLFTDSDKTGESLLQKLKDKLTGVKTLQENASKLAAQGFSQTFIQEVVAQGPDAGNAMSDAILAATPEAIKGMQELYTGITDISETGMTGLADSLNVGMGLATKALKDEMTQVSVDLATALNENQIALNDALASNQKELQDTLVKAQEAYQAAIHELNVQTQKELDALIAKMQEVLALMAALGALSGGGAAAGSTAKPKATKKNTSNVVENFNAGSFRLGEAKSMQEYNLYLTTNTNASALEIQNTVVGGIKYGNVVLSGKGAFDK